MRKIRTVSKIKISYGAKDGLWVRERDGLEIFSLSFPYLFINEVSLCSHHAVHTVEVHISRSAGLYHKGNRSFDLLLQSYYRLVPRVKTVGL